MEVVEGGYGSGEEGCRTPRRGSCEIPATLVCPPAPRKKRTTKKQRSNGPKNGYFQSPDLEIFFAMAPRRDPYCA